MTEFLLVGILSFCFSQNPTSFAEELIAAGTTNADKKETKYYETLRFLQRKYKSHLDSNCNDNAALYRNLGMYFYNNKDRKTTLQYVQDTALQIALNCPTIDHQLITQIYINILSSKLILDEKQSIPPIIERLKWHLEENKAGPISHQAYIQSQISRYYLVQGDNDQSILWIRNSIANHNKIPVSERKLRAYLEWAYILIAFEDYNKSIAVLDSTKILAHELRLFDDPMYNEDLIYNKAVCYEELGEYEQALHFTEVYASMTDPNDLIIRSDVANLKAYVSIGKKNYQQALLQMKESIQLSIESKDDYQISGLVTDYLFMSKAQIQLKDYQKATEAALLAMERTIVPKENWQYHIFNFPNLFVKDPNGFNKAAHSYFQAIVHYESEENIISFADQLDSTFFSLQTYLSGDVSKSEVTSRHHNFCDQFLQYIFEHELENKYRDLTSYYISTSKSLALFEKLSIKEGISEDLRPEYEALNEEWNAIYSALETQESLGNRAIIDSLAEENFQLSLRRDKLDEKLSALNLVPNFRNLRSSLITQAQTNLKADEAIVDFFYGQDQIYSWYLDANGIEFTSDKIHPFLRQDFIPTFSSTAMEFLQNYDQRLDTISNYFAPYFNNLDDQTKKITLIPDGRLLYFPFEVLRVKNKSLIEQANIHYLFSYSINEFLTTENKQQPKPYGGFAMKYNTQLLRGITESKDIYELYKDSFNLSELPYALEEVKLAKELFGGSSYLDAACTRETFFEQAANYQILHIANHALLNEQNSLLSSFVFAKENKADLINLIDIKKLSLNADLAILSSCNSGRGENIEGSGLRSLGLSFAEAGCPAILVNLWEAADKSTKQIIEAFSRYLKQGMAKSAALQKAKLDYIKSAPGELRHPKYWANIVLIGDDSPILFSDGVTKSWLLYLFLTVAILVGGVFLGEKLAGRR